MPPWSLHSTYPVNAPVRVPVMRLRSSSLATMSALHRSAGARAYLAADGNGEAFDPVMQGCVSRFAFSAGLTLSIAEFLNEATCSETVAPAGRRVTLFLRGGSSRQAIEGAGPRALNPGEAILTASELDYQCRLTLTPAQRYRFVSIGFDESLAGGQPAEAQDDPLLKLLDLGRDRLFNSGCPMPPDLQRLGEELSRCPALGACGALLAQARALEIIARIADVFSGAGEFAGGRDQRRVRLSSADVERLHEAKRLLETNLDAPLPLIELARRVGVNVNKLKVGFKSLFGRTVTEHAIESRLAYAHHLLSTEDWLVSSVAYRVGYDPAHFAAAFRRRYGFPPSRLQKRAR